MSGLAEDDLQPRSAGRRWALIVGGLVALALVAALALWLKGRLSTPDAPKRQVSRIAILPDTPPPPPPPPPKDEPKPVPRDDNKPPPPDMAPKPQQAPAAANEPIKMEGAAGDGPSAFAAGAVNREYQGGTPTVGGAPAKGAPTTADRAQERLYANTARGLLRDAIERHLKAEAAQVSAEFTLWLAADGSIRQLQLQPTGDPVLDAALDEALAETRRSLRLPAPPGGLPPMRFKLSVRPLG